MKQEGNCHADQHLRYDMNNIDNIDNDVDMIMI